MISSVITFATHGETTAHRRITQSLNIFFSMMKHYESERLYSGGLSDHADNGLKRPNGKLPMEMPEFNLMGGDLEADLLAPLWIEALSAPAARRLAQRLLTKTNRAPCFNLHQPCGKQQAIPEKSLPVVFQ